MPNVRVTWTMLLWIPASVLLGVGSVLDLRGWTTEHGFASNILAAATSGLFGLPIAAIVAQWILRQDKESRRRRDVVRAARRNFSEMQSSLEAQGIDKVKRLHGPVSAASRDIVLLQRAVNSHCGIVPAQRVRDVHLSFSALITAIPGNEPDDPEDKWEFRSVLRRWDVLKETTFPYGEVDGFRVVADEDYATISANVEVIATQRLEALTQLWIDANKLVTEEELKKPQNNEDVRINDKVAESISGLTEKLRNLRKQLAARSDLYDGLVAARKSAENMPTD